MTAILTVVKGDFVRFKDLLNEEISITWMPN